MSALVFIQQRLGSSRLPKKALAKIGHTTMTEHVISRATAGVGDWNRVVMGVPYKDFRDLSTGSCQVYGIRGDETDLVRRMIRSVEMMEADWPLGRADVIVRITGDTPLLPPRLIKDTIKECERFGGYTYTRADPSGRPDGIDVQAMCRDTFETLKTMHGSMTPEEREHITPALVKYAEHRRLLSHGGSVVLSNIPYFDVSVDTEHDLKRVRRVWDFLSKDEGKDYQPSLTDLIYARLAKPEIFVDS